MCLGKGKKKIKMKQTLKDKNKFKRMLICKKKLREKLSKLQALESTIMKSRGGKKKGKDDKKQAAKKNVHKTESYGAKRQQV